MRAREYDHDGAVARCPLASRLVARSLAAAHAAAAADRRDDVVGAVGLLGLQRAAGNQGVAASSPPTMSSGIPGPPLHEVISSSGGHPLNPRVRADTEARLGHDFGGCPGALTMPARTSPTRMPRSRA